MFMFNDQIKFESKMEFHLLLVLSKGQRWANYNNMKMKGEMNIDIRWY